jgi:23S rRNA pseudouridine2605 synthase
MEERLQKIISRAGVASRRHAEEMMASGLVTVNGKTVTELGTKADLSRDHIKVAGRLIRTEPGLVYIAVNKPPEVVATMSDPEGRRSLRELLYGVKERVFPAGRMEYHASGLILLTNDGDLTNRILQAHKLRQVWLIKLKNLLTFEQIETLGRVTGAKISRLKGKNTPWYQIELAEGRRDALRDKLAQIGNPFEKMRRIAVGNIELGHIPIGGHRPLSDQEIAALNRILAGEKPPFRKSSSRRPKRREKPSSHKKK